MSALETSKLKSIQAITPDELPGVIGENMGNLTVPAVPESIVHDVIKAANDVLAVYYAAKGIEFDVFFKDSRSTIKGAVADGAASFGECGDPECTECNNEINPNIH